MEGEKVPTVCDFLDMLKTDARPRPVRRARKWQTVATFSASLKTSFVELLKRTKWRARKWQPFALFSPSIFCVQFYNNMEGEKVPTVCYFLALQNTGRNMLS